MAKPIEHDPRSTAEAAEFKTLVGALKADIDAFKAIDFKVKTSEDFLIAVSTPIRELSDAAKIASKTPTLKDDASVSALQKMFFNAIDQKVKEVPGLPTAEQNSMKNFIKARVRLKRVLNSPRADFAEPQQKAAAEALQQIRDESVHIIDPKNQTIVENAISTDESDYNSSGLEKVEPLIKNLRPKGEHDLLPALADVKTSAFGTDQNRVAALISELRDYAATVSTVNTRGKLEADQEERLNEHIIPVVEQLLQQQKTPEGRREAAKLEQIVREIQHEQNVNMIDKSKRNFLRPTIVGTVRDPIPPNMDGVIEMVIGSMSQDISQAEAIGRKMAAAETITPGSGASVVTPDELIFLQDFKNRFNTEFTRQVMGMEDTLEDTAYITQFSNYMGKYSNWINTLISTASSGGAGGTGGAPGSKESDPARETGGLIKRFLSSPEVGFREDQVNALSHEQLSEMMWGWYLQQVDKDVGPAHYFYESGFNASSRTFPGIIPGTTLNFGEIVGNMADGAIINDDLYALNKIFEASKRMFEYRQKKGEFASAVSNEVGVLTKAIASAPFKIKYRVMPFAPADKKPPGGFPDLPNELPVLTAGEHYQYEVRTIGDYMREGLITFFEKVFPENDDDADEDFNILFKPKEGIESIAAVLTGVNPVTGDPNPETTAHLSIAKLVGIYLEAAMMRGSADKKVVRNFYQLSYLVNTRKTRRKYVSEAGRNTGNPGLELTIGYFDKLYKPTIQRYLHTFHYDPAKHPPEMAAFDGQKKSYLRWLMDGRVKTDAIPENGFPEGAATQEEQVVQHSESVLKAINEGTKVEWLKVAKDVSRRDRSTYTTFDHHQAVTLTGLERSAFYYWNNDYRFDLDKAEYDNLVQIWSDPVTPEKMKQREDRGYPIRSYKRDADGAYLDKVHEHAIDDSIVERIKAGDPNTPDIRKVAYSEIFTPKMVFMGDAATHAADHAMHLKEINQKQADFLNGAWARVQAADDQLTALIQYQMEIIILAEFIQIAKDGAQVAEWSKDPQKNIKAITELLSFEAYLKNRGGWRKLYYNQSNLGRLDVVGKATGQEIPEGKYTGFGLLSEQRVNDLLNAAGLMNFKKIEAKK